uniref:Virion structural protein n=1 Tax=Pseudomonas phage HRDY3 TaxID=3236930 RepID=A0AB39CE03_9VIRU
MIAQTPNLRFVKPLSRYMELRIRMFGRQRFAKTYSTQGSNVSQATMPFTVTNPSALEIYNDGIRVLDGYVVNGNVVSFGSPKKGKLDFVEDDQFPDMNEKWLVIPTNNLLQSNDTSSTAYGTDRRAGQQVATHAKPVCITQGAIGFCRPSADGEQLLYCPYYGIYGRDSVTYAIKTDMGQLSDFRCIDIRVRDPNYIPTMRLAVISADSNPVQVDGQTKDIVANGNYQIYGAVETGGQIKLPNPLNDDLKEYHFVIQGKDENGDWFGPEEYFDPGTYEIKAQDRDGFTVVYSGDASVIGVEDAWLITVTAKRTGETLPIEVKYMEQTLFTGSITSNAPTPLNQFALQPVDPELTLDKGGDESPIWTFNDDWVLSTGISLKTEWKNPAFETRNVSARMQVGFLFNLYNPETQVASFSVPFDKTVNGSFTTAEDPAGNAVIQPENSTQLLATGRYWKTSDQFSDWYQGDCVLNISYEWQIATEAQ